MTRVGVLLSGCGVFDGAEIHEAVITLLALDRADAEACAVDETCRDVERGVISTPAYMLAGRISESAAGIEKLVREVLDLADQKTGATA